MTERFARLHLVAALVGLITVGAVGFAQEIPDSGPELVQVDAGAADLALPAPTEPPATASAPTPDDPESFLGTAVNLGKDRQWWPLASLLILGAVWALRKFGFGWFGMDMAGNVKLALVLDALGSFFSGAYSLLVDGSPPGWDLLLHFVKVAIPVVVTLIPTGPKKAAAGAST